MTGEAPAKRRGRPPSGGREAILQATLDLLRDNGIGRLTTREIAQRAGVSEASVFYHYSDRAGLLQAVLAHGLEPLKAFTHQPLRGDDLADTLARRAAAVDDFLDAALPVMIAAQSEPELRDGLAAYMRELDMGPHRGVERLAAYLADEQQAGRLRAHDDPEAVAALLIGESIMRALIRLVRGNDDTLPSRERTSAAAAALLEP